VNAHRPTYTELDSRHVRVTCSCKWSDVGAISGHTRVSDGHSGRPDLAAARLHDQHWAEVVAEPLADRVFAERVPVRDEMGRVHWRRVANAVLEAARVVGP
jgi:hypothetical protein